LAIKDAVGVGCDSIPLFFFEEFLYSDIQGLEVGVRWYLIMPATLAYKELVVVLILEL
jgi:hypothetical protein